MKHVVMKCWILDAKMPLTVYIFPMKFILQLNANILENQYIMKRITAWLKAKIAWNTVLLSVIRLYYHYVWLLLI